MDSTSVRLIIEKLEALGRAGVSDAWPLLVKGQLINGWSTLAFGLTALLLGATTLFLGVKEDRRDSLGVGIPLVLFGCVLLLVGVVAVFCSLGQLPPGKPGGLQVRRITVLRSPSTDARDPATRLPRDAG